MGVLELLMVAGALSMDAFAVALCRGLSMQRFQPRGAAITALFFGGFQALMPLLGWLLGTQFQRFITPVDHWIAFVLLALIGGKMIWEALHEDDGTESADDGETLRLRELLLMAIATSIDALAVGVTFAFLQVRILPSVTLIGLVTFVLSFAGVAVGNRFGARFEKKAELAGGVVLLLIGLKILLEHLGVL